MAVQEMPQKDRAIGLLCGGCGVASIALLALHPEVPAHNFAEVLKNEAASRAIDAVVHGGFILILGVQLVCYARLSARLGLPRLAELAGLIFFAMGVAFLCASMVLDGLVTPAIAQRYLDHPDKIDLARNLFILLSALISVLMPLGLAFQSAAIAAWGCAMLRSSRRLGILVAALGALMLIALAANIALGNPLVWMIALAGTALWALIAGGLLWTVHTG